MDIAKLIFGGIILASIMKKDIDTATLLGVGALVTLLFAGSGFVLILASKNKKENSMELLVFEGFFALLAVIAAVWAFMDSRKMNQ